MKSCLKLFKGEVMAKSNFMEVKFKALSINEGFARICVAGFCVQLNPSIDELDDIKTSVSEAVTNCVVHAYPDGEGEIFMRCEIEGDSVKIIIKDAGVGIKDIQKAKEPFYTTTVMESFMDGVEVEKNEFGGTTVTMYKQISNSVLQVGSAG